jgi:hypothetical protein
MSFGFEVIKYVTLPPHLPSNSKTGSAESTCVTMPLSEFSLPLSSLNLIMAE